MDRLISLFRQAPDEYETVAEDFPTQDRPLFPGEPEYFEQLMQYLRRRNQEASVWYAGRQGAD